MCKHIHTEAQFVFCSFLYISICWLLLAKELAQVQNTCDKEISFKTDFENDRLI